MIKKVFSAIFFLIFTFQVGFAQQDAAKRHWVDSVFNTLNLEEKIGQLFMVAAYSSGNEQHHQVIEQLIARNEIGGLIFMQGNPKAQALLTNRFQSVSEVPLLIAMDAEWGLGMRLDGTLSYPKQMTLGALEDNQLIYKMGADIAQQLKQLGVHINFAPVVDINNNPKNPVIGPRSFGEDKTKVAEKASAYMKGLQDNGILAVAKHFPGHGDTDKDSHQTLPVINHSKDRMEQVELYPFRELIKNGVNGVMTGHLQVNAYDKNNPASLSNKITTNLLRKEMGFKGLVFSDALNMKAVANAYESVELEALLAGNDVLLFSQNVPGAIKTIKKAIRKKKLSKNNLDEKVRKILSAKYDASLHQFQPINTDNILLKANSPTSTMLKQDLYEKAITVAKNEADLLPIRVLDNKYFASVNFSGSEVLDNYLEKYTYFFHYDQSTFSPRKLRGFDYIVAGFTQKPSTEELNDLKSLAEKTNVIICYFGSPYDLDVFEDFDQLICTYQNDSLAQVAAAEVIFGAISANGKLPVSVSGQLKKGTGHSIAPLSRMAYSNPEAVFMDSRKLQEIDKIVQEAIKDQATPGCQVLVARYGKVIYDKSYGYYSYDSLKPVTDQTIYDIASVTKVFASMQAFMFLEERGLVDLDKKISTYLPELKGTNKENMIFRDILTHQAGLWPYLPFWKQTLGEDSLYRADFYYDEINTDYPNQVSYGLFASPVLKDSVWQWVKQSKLRPKKYRTPYDYKYSDMGYYIVTRLAEKLLNQPIEEFLQQNFYDPMGLSTMSYLPLCKYPLDRIAPTEEDNYFRRTLVYGMVHDQGAALLGGVAGHAGLFSNAHDMAKMMYMHLNGGEYGGQRYFNEETIEKFTARQYMTSRRGLGWDKPLRGEWFGPTSEFASSKTFGHTGFTGTAVWADPEFDLIYVFLSNRIHPNAENRKLIKNNIRTRIQDIIYESIWEYQQHDVKMN